MRSSLNARSLNAMLTVLPFFCLLLISAIYYLHIKWLSRRLYAVLTEKLCISHQKILEHMVNGWQIESVEQCNDQRCYIEVTKLSRLRFGTFVVRTIFVFAFHFDQMRVLVDVVAWLALHSLHNAVFRSTERNDFV